MSPFFCRRHECVLTYSAVQWWSFGLALIALTWSGVARADRALTLPEALKLARENNRDLAVARARLDEASAGVTQAWAALLPTAQAQGTYTHNYKEANISFPNFPGLDLPKGPIVILKQNALQGTVGATVPIVAPAAYPALAAAKQSFAAAQANFKVSETAILFSSAQAFFAAAGADELLHARQDAVKVAQVTVNNAQARLEAGTVNRTEVTRADLALLNAQQAEREAEDVRAQAYRALATILVLHEPVYVVPPEEGPTPAAPPPVSALATQALTLRPEVAAAQAAIHAAEDQISAATWRWAPTLSAFGDYSKFNYAGFTNDDYAWATGLELNWALFDGGLRIAARRQAEAQRVEGEEQLSELRDTIRDDIANAERALSTQRMAVKTAQQSVALAKETLNLLRAQYEAGTATELDVLQAQDALVAAEVELAQARFNRALSSLTLKRVSGTFLNESSEP